MFTNIQLCPQIRKATSSAAGSGDGFSLQMSLKQFFLPPIDKSCAPKIIPLIATLQRKTIAKMNVFLHKW